MDDIHKLDFIRLVARRAGITQKLTEQVMDAITDELAAQLTADVRVVWTGLGSFEVRERTEKRGVNPQTKEVVMQPPSRYPGFTSSYAFRARVTGYRPNDYRRKSESAAAD